MTLQQWCENAWLKRITPTGEEVAGLLSIAEREISDASLDGMSADGRLDRAYSAVRSLCDAALRASGFAAAKGTRQHERVIESLRFTLGDSWADDADYFDRCRRMRHGTLYDSAGTTRPEDARELLETARRLHKAVREWLAQHHPDLT